MPLLDPQSGPAVQELLVIARASGRAGEVRVRPVSQQRPVAMSATPFRNGDRQCLLVRARAVSPGTEFFEQMPEAAVITDSNGRIRMANPAFLALARTSEESRLVGWLVGDALGDVVRQWPALLAQVRMSGIVGRTTVRLHVAGAPPMDAEVSAALLAEGDQEDIGFTLRPLEAPVASDALASGLADLVGRLGQVSLPELLVQSVHWMERHLVETALERSQGHVQGAAALLGIAPEALLLRLHRLGLGDKPLLN